MKWLNYYHHHTFSEVAESTTTTQTSSDVAESTTTTQAYGEVAKVLQLPPHRHVEK